MNYYAFHIGDYISATKHLTWDEDMAYRRLLDAYYTREMALPLDVNQVYRLACATTPEQRAAVDTVLAEFFEKTESGWSNARCDEVIYEAAEKRAKAAQSARSRWGDANAVRSHSERIANAMPTQCEGNAPNPNPNPNTQNQEKNQKQARASLALPEWLPIEQWAAFVEMRKRMKASLTDRAVMLAIGELEKLRAQGHDPAKVLDQSVANGWKGLFPIKSKGGNIRGAPPAGYLSETNSDLLEALQRQSGEVPQ